MLLSRRSRSPKAVLLRLWTSHTSTSTNRFGLGSSCHGEFALLPKRIRRSLFRESNTGIDLTQLREKIKRSLKNAATKLVPGELSYEESIAYAIEKYKFAPPDLAAPTVSSHFETIAYEQSDAYRLMLEEFIKSSYLPPKPAKWKKKLGWTKYTESGTSCVPFPDAEVLVFDVEVCVKESQCPVIAVAASSDAWYSWCSPMLMAKTLEEIEKGREFALRNLIPLESKLDEPLTSMKSAKRLVIGHNVSYDRRRIREQYAVEKTPLRFLDTMSLHIAVCGFARDQQTLFFDKMDGFSYGSRHSKPIEEMQEFVDLASKDWIMRGATNSLLEVWRFHCPNSCLKIDKETRNIFVVGTLEDVHKDFQNLMDYCANDVAATFEVICAVWPIFYERIPHPVTLAGMLDMGLMYLPINYMWPTFLKNCEEAYEKQQNEVTDILSKLAEDACALAMDETYKTDPWLFDLDWSLPAKTAIKVKGLPAWFRKMSADQSVLAEEKPPLCLTTMDIVQNLLRMSWCGYPLYKSSTRGWGYLVPDSSIVSWPIGLEFDGFTKLMEGVFEKEVENSTEGESQAQLVQFPFEAIVAAVKETRSKYCYDQLSEEEIHLNKEPCADIKLPGCRFYKLTHRGRKNSNNGSPLWKEFSRFITEKLPRLVSADPGVLKELALITRNSSYWESNRSRIMEEAYAMLDGKDIPDDAKRSDEYSADKLVGAILPQTVVSGTVTRRAVEKTWLTFVSNKTDGIGSELKAMLHAPPGYVFVSANVDDQEMWIAAMFGDRMLQRYGSSPFSRMLIDGGKAKGSTYHSYIAEQIGIETNQAKSLSYVRLQGGAVSSAVTYLQICGLSRQEAKEKAEKLYAMTKGSLKHVVDAEVLKHCKISTTTECVKDIGCNRALVTEKVLVQLAVELKKNAAELSLARRWSEGTESDIFNFLDDLVKTEQPRTPVLNCCITRTLEPKFVGKQFFASRTNWAIQSSGVDYTHLLITAMNWLMDKYAIKGRLSISIHDEVYYIVKRDDAYRAALALQTANLMTRAMFVEALGFKDLPLSLAFFSSVEIDRLLRKEVDMECITPSNADGLMKTYGIPHGEALTIESLLEKTGGSLLPLQTSAHSAQNIPLHPETSVSTDHSDLSSVLTPSKMVSRIRTWVASHI